MKYLKLLPILACTAAMSVNSYADFRIIPKQKAPVDASDINNILFPFSGKVSPENIPTLKMSEASQLTILADRGELINMLGYPNINIVSPRQLDYVINVIAPHTQNVERCQIQFHLDENDKITYRYWNNKECMSTFDMSLARSPSPKVEPLIVMSLPDKAPKPQKPIHQSYHIGAETLFDFNGYKREDITRSGTQAVFDVFNQINYAFDKVQSITVTGHTDRIGSEAYNYDLGLKRAETVKMLLSEFGFHSDKIFAKSVGELEPSGFTNDCQGQGEQLRECLKPDRRVVISVLGD